MDKQLFIIQNKTNLHCGAGGSNYGVIDNLIQRDATDQFPTVYSSSLKGALREWFKAKEGDKMTKDVFGHAETTKSSVHFSDAHLLAMPLRSNKRPYLMATSPYLLHKFKSIVFDDWGITNDTLKAEIDALLDHKNEAVLFGKLEPNEHIEDLQVAKNVPLQGELIKQILGSSFVVVSDEDMKYFASDYSLPVIARNCLENGQSANLWYEQLLPRLSVLYTIGIFEEKSKVVKEMLSKSPMIQLGANATIGYGQCKLTSL